MHKNTLCLNKQCPSWGCCALRFVPVRDRATAEEFTEACLASLDTESPAGCCEEFVPAARSDVQDALAQGAGTSGQGEKMVEVAQ